jgi:hypothetical protein
MQAAETANMVTIDLFDILHQRRKGRDRVIEGGDKK